MFMAVDLPEPLGPMIARNSPGSTPRSMPLSAWNAAGPSPYVLVMADSSMRGAALMAS